LGVPGFPPPPPPPPPQAMSEAASAAEAIRPKASLSGLFLAQNIVRRNRVASSAAPPVKIQLGPGNGMTVEGAVVVIVSVVVPLPETVPGIEHPGPSVTAGDTAQVNETVPENPPIIETVIVELADWPGEIGAGVVPDKLKSGAVTVIAKLAV